MYGGFRRVVKVIDLISAYIEDVEGVLRELLVLDNSRVVFDGRKDIVVLNFGDEDVVISDKYIKMYVLYLHFLEIFENEFDDTLDLLSSFISRNGDEFSFLEMVNGVSSIVEFRKIYGYETNPNDIEYLRDYFLFIHGKLCEIDSL